jgi:hypothetical protein
MRDGHQNDDDATAVAHVAYRVNNLRDLPDLRLPQRS